jgi:hypothetical protein
VTIHRTPAELAASLDAEEREYLVAVGHHACGPMNEAEMLASERLIGLHLIHDVRDPVCGDTQRQTPLGRAVAEHLARNQGKA